MDRVRQILIEYPGACSLEKHYSDSGRWALARLPLPKVEILKTQIDQDRRYMWAGFAPTVSTAEMRPLEKHAPASRSAMYTKAYAITPRLAVSGDCRYEAHSSTPFLSRKQNTWGTGWMGPVNQC